MGAHTRLVRRLAATVVAVWVVAPHRSAAWAQQPDHAFASASGNHWGQGSYSNTDAGPLTADARVHRDPAGPQTGTIDAFSQADSSPALTDFNRSDVTLHASARAQAPGDIPPGALLGGGAGALARWEDPLKIDNADLSNIPLFGLMFFFFSPTLHGTIEGVNGRALFLADVGGGQARREFTAPGSYDEFLSFKVPCSLFVPVGTGEFPTTLSLSLSASASTARASETSSADFGETARLGTIVVADADGNYVPGSEDVRLIGESGLLYDVRAAPEPSSLVLGSFGLGLIAGRRRRGES